MPKADYDRDYYADLELPPTADVVDIKKQFKKLALKYHPDRNPGKEAEANVKFQTIQSAHELLTSPSEKTKYDASRARRTRYPTASGVKGNPWQNVSAQRPPPPQRPSMPKRTPPSAASRYSNFASAAPPSPKTSTKDDPKTRQAWESMRQSSKGRATQSSGGPSISRPGNNATAEPQTMPQTRAARQKAEASFGNRKTGFVPGSPFGDDPPVTNKNYSTSRQRTNLFAEANSNPGKTSRAPSGSWQKNPMQGSFLDPRQSTPYQTHGGEKTNPFDGVNLNRAKSTRDSARRDFAPEPESPPASDRRQRSSSVPDNSEQAHKNGTDPFTTPKKQRTGAADDFNGTPGESDGSKVNDGPTVYAPPKIPSSYSANFRQAPEKREASGWPTRSTGKGVQKKESPFFSPRTALSPTKNGTTPSGEQRDSRESLTPLESRLRSVLRDLINTPSRRSLRLQKGSGEERKTPPKQSPNDRRRTDYSKQCSFTFNVDGDTFARTSPAHGFSRNSEDNINTRFVTEEYANTQWQFNAGGARSGQASPSSARAGRRSPTKDRSRPRKTPLGSSTAESGTESKTSGFDAEGWTQKIGPQDFAPQPQQSNSTSPTRPIRPARKPKPVRPTMGTAGLVDEETSSEDRTRPGTAAEPRDSGVDSTNAMDIDSPPVAPSDAVPSGGVRNVPVEPSRPEWRPGVANGAKPDAQPGATAQTGFNSNMGSEDQEDFRASFAELKRVEPFAERAYGLGSFDDLKSSLPFETKASAKIPIEKKTPQKPKIPFPQPPMVPPPPSTLAIPGMKPTPTAWDKYTQEFQLYMREWQTFNTRFIDHFLARKKEIDKMGGPSMAWLDSRGGEGIKEYLSWLEQDREVREKWTAACNDHEDRVREFITHRNKMMK